MWTEKYRPHQISAMKGNPDIYERVQNLIEQAKIDFNDLPHFMFLGPAGGGKTTLAMIIAEELFGPNWKAENRMIFYNASDARKIDDVRNDISKNVRLSGKRIIFMDECDASTKDAQQALRALIETAGRKEVRFIFTGNFEKKFIEAMLSRSVTFRFKPLFWKDILRTLVEILIKENVIKVPNDLTEKEKEALTYLAKTCKGDLRSAINSVQSLVDGQKKIRISEFMINEESKIVVSIMDNVMDDKWDTAFTLLEDAVILNRFTHERIIEEMREYIKKLSNQEVRIRLIRELSTCADRCSHGNDVLTHLSSFIGYAYIIKYLPNNCPAKN